MRTIPSCDTCDQYQPPKSHILRHMHMIWLSCLIDWFHMLILCLIRSSIRVTNMRINKEQSCTLASGKTYSCNVPVAMNSNGLQTSLYICMCACDQVCMCSCQQTMHQKDHKHISKTKTQTRATSMCVVLWIHLCHNLCLVCCRAFLTWFLSYALSALCSCVVSVRMCIVQVWDTMFLANMFHCTRLLCLCCKREWLHMWAWPDTNTASECTTNTKFHCCKRSTASECTINTNFHAYTYICAYTTCAYAKCWW